MQHVPAPLVHVDAVVQEPAVHVTRGVGDRRHVRLAGEQHPHVDPAARRLAERVADGPVRDEVAVGDVDALRRPPDPFEVGRPDRAALAEEVVGEHPHAGVALRDEALRRRLPFDRLGLVLVVLVGELVPGVEEDRPHRAHGQALDAHHVVAPAFAPFALVRPLIGDVDATGEPDAPVDDEHLPVIAAIDHADAEASAPGGDGVVVDDPNAGGAHRLEDRRVRLDAPDGVVDEGHAHALPGLVHQGVREAPTGLVRAEPVHLQEHFVPSVFDRVQHGGKALGAVVEQGHAGVLHVALEAPLRAEAMP